MSETALARQRADVFAMSDLSTPWCVMVAATLEVAERIAAGATRIEDLAENCRADANALGRVLRHLVREGVFEEPQPGTFALNESARLLLSPQARWLRLDGFGGRMAHAWSGLLTATRTGKPAYSDLFGRPFWEDLQANPVIAADFDELMSPAGHGAPDPNVLLNNDWQSVRTVVDVGGGTGALLAEILRTRPTLQGTLVDQPATVARSGKIFESAGVTHRAKISGQSFFDPLPAGADLYLLKSVLSDWPDTEAELILRRCALAARPNGGRVVILNGVAPDEMQTSPNLLMLVLVGGKDRSLNEFRALAQTAGLAVTAAGSQPSGRFLVECRTL